MYSGGCLCRCVGVRACVCVRVQIARGHRSDRGCIHKRHHSTPLAPNSACAGNMATTTVHVRMPQRADARYTTKYNKEWLDAMRRAGDPFADAVVADLHATAGLVNIKDLLGVVRERAQLPNGKIYADFLNETLRMPRGSMPNWLSAASKSRPRIQCPWAPRCLRARWWAAPCFRAPRS